MAIVPQNIGNKQDELKVLLQEDKYNLIGITETYWIDLYDLNINIEGNKRNRSSRRGERRIDIKNIQVKLY